MPTSNMGILHGLDRVYRLFATGPGRPRVLPIDLVKVFLNHVSVHLKPQGRLCKRELIRTNGGQSTDMP